MEVIELMKALSHETRLRVLNLLIEKDGLCVCDLYEVLHMPQPTISRHLKLLRDAGLVQDYRENQWVHYKIHPELSAPRRKVLLEVLTLAKEAVLFQADIKRLSEIQLAVCC